MQKFKWFVKKWMSLWFPLRFVQPRQMCPKAKRIMIHALERAGERFDVQLSRRQYWRLVARVRFGRLGVVADVHSGKKYLKLKLPDGQAALVLYAAHYRMIGTFVHPESMEKKIQRQKPRRSHEVCLEKG